MWVIELIDKGGGCDTRYENDETGGRCFSWVSPSLSVEVAQSRNSSFQMGAKVCGVPTHMWSTTPWDVTVFSVPFQSEFPSFSLVLSRKLLLMQENVIAQWLVLTCIYDSARVQWDVFKICISLLQYWWIIFFFCSSPLRGSRFCP